MTNEQYEASGGAIISSFICTHYLEEVLRLKVPFVKQQAKQQVKRTLKILREVEKHYYDTMDDKDGQFTSQLSDSLQTIIEDMLAQGYTKFNIIGKIIHAYNKNPKAIEGIANKIIKNDG